ncbi:MAG: hypothetical protein IM574_10315 [Cytophagales bacterium]|nr:hypothetical protein [Cytophagales bacterium]MCA6390733.1 hypothetical protein [Cytophagales bacterium]MCA6396984.1 hypothetical protein [Cytophagales bacterium]MCA6403939.1 hypothetical protein [Cytophagales bacterium]MCA6405811.1 hypothetical protein [Cytophagales bacterium]
MKKIKQLKKVLKQMVRFFVLQLLEIVLETSKCLKILNINMLERYLLEFQFSVSASGFSVLVPAPGKFNPFYRASGFLKFKNNGNTKF